MNPQRTQNFTHIELLIMIAIIDILFIGTVFCQ